eukprot:5641930-Pyramimonas_sp.AAC.1
MLYEQEHNIFHIIDRCIRYATGIEIPDKTMTSILDADHQCGCSLDRPRYFTLMERVPLTTTLRKQSPRQKALNLGYVRVDNTLQGSWPEMASYAIYFTPWRLNSIG